MNEVLDVFPARVLEMCKSRNWNLHWTARGAYLHLESSELIEAVRGKHGDPTEEAGDVLIVLMSITENAGIPFSNVFDAAKKKVKRIHNELVMHHPTAYWWQETGQHLYRRKYERR
jgi:NTP pyrophosphatase (non-canonical NTP hydrolase)